METLLLIGRQKPTKLLNRAGLPGRKAVTSATPFQMGCATASSGQAHQPPGEDGGIEKKSLGLIGFQASPQVQILGGAGL